MLNCKLYTMMQEGQCLAHILRLTFHREAACRHMQLGAGGRRRGQKSGGRRYWSYDSYPTALTSIVSGVSLYPVLKKGHGINIPAQ